MGMATVGLAIPSKIVRFPFAKGRCCKRFPKIIVSFKPILRKYHLKKSGDSLGMQSLFDLLK